MGIGPVFAVPKLLKRQGLTVADIDVWELNEAFASQVVYCRDKLGIDMTRLNPNGGSIGIGHPFGMTGSRLVGTIACELLRKKLRYGLSRCASVAVRRSGALRTRLSRRRRAGSKTRPTADHGTSNDLSDDLTARHSRERFRRAIGGTSRRREAGVSPRTIPKPVRGGPCTGSRRAKSPKKTPRIGILEQREVQRDRGIARCEADDEEPSAPGD
jgi:hypothetical protein